MRTTLTDTALRAQLSTSRATIREVDDDHLMQEVKKADVFHGETPTEFERWQMVGMTAVPLKQKEEQGQGQQGSQQKSSDDSEWDHNQPKGEAAEALMVYVNGSRSHPVAIVDDRRVRPYGMKAGEGAHYAPDGSEQMVLFKKNGTYIVSLDGKSVEDDKANETRMVSLRHVKKDMQTHKIEKQQQGQQQKEPYKHEGKSVNTEVRCTADKIEFYSGTTLKAVYTVSSDTWVVMSGTNVKLTLTPDKIVGEHGNRRFAANSVGAQIKVKGTIYHATATNDDLICGKAWTIGPDPMAGV